MPFTNEGGFVRRAFAAPAYVPPVVPPDPYAGAGLHGIIGSPTAQVGYRLQKGTRDQNVAYALRRLALLQQIGLGGTPGEDTDPLEAYTAASKALTLAAHEAGFADPRQYLVWRLKEMHRPQRRGGV
jgi:hypothetical protein